MHCQFSYIETAEKKKTKFSCNRFNLPKFIVAGLSTTVKALVGLLSCCESSTSQYVGQKTFTDVLGKSVII